MPNTREALADIVGLTDGELRDFSSNLGDLIVAEDFGAARRLIADWALTIRIRNHPDYAANASAFAAAVDQEDIPGRVA